MIVSITDTFYGTLSSLCDVSFYLPYKYEKLPYSLQIANSKLRMCPLYTHGFIIVSRDVISFRNCSELRKPTYPRQSVQQKLKP